MQILEPFVNYKHVKGIPRGENAGGVGNRHPPTDKIAQFAEQQNPEIAANLQELLMSHRLVFFPLCLRFMKDSSQNVLQKVLLHIIQYIYIYI